MTRWDCHIDCDLLTFRAHGFITGQMNKRVYMIHLSGLCLNSITICLFLIIISLQIVTTPVRSDDTIAPSDPASVELSSLQPKTVQPAAVESPSGERNGSDVKAEQPDEENQLLKDRQSELKRLEQAVADEEQLMLNAVQIMDRGEAIQWMARFMSAQPLNCPVKSQIDWINAIIDAVERNRLPICKEALGLVSCIVAMESGFRVDPLAVDPSREHDMSGMLVRAEKEFEERYGILLRVPPVPRFYGAYREKYYGQLLACKTEGEVEVIARNIVADLKRDASRLPKVITKVIDRELEKLIYVVRTKGSMQLNFIKARQVMAERGEVFTDSELTDYMYTLHGGVDVGVAALKPMFVQYAAKYARPGDLSWLFLVGMDYHYGPFSSRNMMEQIRIRDLSGKKIALDGDLLHYNDYGKPADKVSETFRAVATTFPSLGQSSILKAFVLEKDQHYIYTDLHRAILQSHTERFGETPFAVVGELWMGENAQIKHGAGWKTNSYLKKLDRYLNSLPWDN
jgi:hypothetical protein